MLFNMAPDSDVSILSNKVFDSVNRIALITSFSEGEKSMKPLNGIYSLQPFKSRHPKFLGKWDDEYFSKWNILFPDRYPSFEGYKFELATWKNDMPYLYKSNYSSEDNYNVSGVSVKILDTLASVLNFSYTMTEKSDDLKWGILENGSWVGVLGMVHRGEKNFTVQGFTQTYDRSQEFDPSHSLPAGAAAGVFLLKPERLPMWPNIYKSFTADTWSAVVAVFIAALLILKLQVSRVCNMLIN